VLQARGGDRERIDRLRRRRRAGVDGDLEIGVSLTFDTALVDLRDVEGERAGLRRRAADQSGRGVEAEPVRERVARIEVVAEGRTARPRLPRDRVRVG